MDEVEPLATQGGVEQLVDDASHRLAQAPDHTAAQRPPGDASNR